MFACMSDLSEKDAVVDHGVEQHQREDEKALAPEHEGKARMRRGSLVDGDRERNHVGPERDRQRAFNHRQLLIMAVTLGDSAATWTVQSDGMDLVEISH